jgi:hypothetical protein
MEIRPTVQFPDQYDEIYYPGRKASGRVGYLVGGWFAALGAIGIYDALTSPPPGVAPAQGALFCALFFGFGMALIVLMAMVRGRTAIALTAEGLYYRDWRNRVWHIAWTNLEQVSVREYFWREGGSIGGMQQETAYLTGRFAPGGRTTVKVNISSRMQLVETKDIHPDPMMASIIRRAGLVPREGRPREKVWVSNRGSGL